MEGYRSGHNEAVLKTVWVSKPAWVRIPYLPPYWGVAKRFKASVFDADIRVFESHHPSQIGM